jgi:hypothetical protein
VPVVRIEGVRVSNLSAPQQVRIVVLLAPPL